jgi:branched-chain amino acid transport system substrate-binding protein
MIRKLIPVLLILSVAACSTSPTSPPESTVIAPPSATSQPPTATPLPTATLLPTDTPVPSDTPLPNHTPLPTDTPIPEISPTPFTCSDRIGCVQVNPGEAIQMAYILDLSGPAAGPGIDSLNGLQFAIERAGMLLGHDVQLVGEDEGCDAEKGRAAALKYAEEPKLIAVFGTTCSRSARAVFPWLSKAGMVILSPSNTSPMLTEEGRLTRYEGYYRVIYSDKQQGIMAARLAVEKLQVSTAAVVSNSDPFYQEIQAGFDDEFTRLGGQVLQKVTLDDSRALTSVLGSLAAKGPQMIYLANGDFNLVKQFIAQVRQTPGLEKVFLVGFENLFNPDLETVDGMAADGLLISQTSLQNQDNAYEAEILPAFRQKYGEPQFIFHAYAIDAVNLLYAAIQDVGVVYPDGTLYIPRQALRDTLNATQDFPGVTGLLTCNDTGDCGDPGRIVFVEYHFGNWPPVQFWP